MRMGRTLAAGIAAAAVGSMALAAPSVGSVGFVSYPNTPDPPDVGQVEIESFSWGLSQTGSFGSGGGGGAGKANFQDLHFTTKPTSGFPRLAYLSATGKPIKNVRLDVGPPEAMGGVETVYCAQNALVKRLEYNTLGSSGQDGVSVDLLAQKLSVQAQLSAGGITVATFDLKTNSFSFGASNQCPSIP